jgi:glucose/arabinose dehydrogenase
LSSFALATRRFLLIGALTIGGLAIGVSDQSPAQSSRTLPTTGTTTPTGPAVSLTLLANADQPISVVPRPRDDALYVLQKNGKVSALTSKGLAGGPVLDISERLSTDNERGLIGLAFSPVDDAHLYVTYSEKDGTLVVSEFTFNGTVAEIGSERVLLRLPHPNNDHNGGALAFSEDGLLWIAFGDGGGVGTKGAVGDRNNYAQNVNVLYGKLLRIDPRKPADGKPYSIPPSNPFAKGVAGTLGSSTKARPEIYAYGLRNPWRFAISSDAQLWIPDVGQSSFEEINHIGLDQAGANFGWRQREGTHAYRGGRKPVGSVDPLYEFPHADGRCAVIGGAAAVTGPWSSAGANSELQDAANTKHTYYFGELCTGKLYQLAQTPKGATVRELGAKLSYLTSVAIANDGNLYVTSLNGGVYRVDKR